MAERDIIDVLSDLESPIRRIKTMTSVMFDLTTDADSRPSGDVVGELASVIFEAADKLQSLFGEGFDLATAARRSSPSQKREA